MYIYELERKTAIYNHTKVWDEKYFVCLLFKRINVEWYHFSMHHIFVLVLFDV